MNYFERKLDLILEESEVPHYLHPDYIYNMGMDGITFIDTGDGILYGKVNSTHVDVLLANEEYLNSIAHQIVKDHGEDAFGYEDNVEEEIRHDWLERYALLGRAAFVTRETSFLPQYLDESGFELPTLLISYWDDSSGSVLDSAKKVIEKIQPDPNIPIIISSPQYGTFPLGNEPEKKELTPEKQQELNTMRQLHLMNPEQKKQAMKKLGLGSSGKPSAGQRAGLAPGQKYWAMSSEGKRT